MSSTTTEESDDVTQTFSEVDSTEQPEYIPSEEQESDKEQGESSSSMTTPRDGCSKKSKQRVQRRCSTACQGST